MNGVEKNCQVRVLLVEDDEQHAAIVGFILENASPESFRLDWTPDYESGLEALAKNEHDVALVDYKLGSGNGLDLIREMRNRGLQIPMILLTGQGDDDVDRAAMDIGASDCLDKFELAPALLKRSIRYAIARQTAEHALRESEWKKRAIIESAKDTILLMTPDGTILEANSAACDRLNLARTDLLGRNVFDLLPPELALSRRAAVERVIRTKKAIALEDHRSGLELEHDVSPVFDGRGQVIAIAIVSRDVTRRVHSERRLLAARKQLVNAIENISEGFVMFDQDERLVLCNERYRQLFPLIVDLCEPGVTFEKLARAAIETGQVVLPPGMDPEKAVVLRTEKFRNPGMPFDQQLASNQWVRVSERKTGDGYLISLRTEITELKERETKLKESEARFRDFAQSAADWFWEADPDFRFTYLSERYQEATGFSPEGLLGRTVDEVFSDPNYDGDKWKLVFKRLENHQPIHNFEIGATRPDGVLVIVRISASPVFDGKGEFKGYRGTATDITRQKQAEEERADLEKALQMSQRMEALGQLSGGMAHEFNNMLVPVIAMTELTIDDLPEESPERGNLDVALEAAKRARNLIRQILAFARAEDRRQEPVNIVSTVRQATKMLRVTLSPGIEVNERYDIEAATVICDLTQIHQILMNLGKNAADAMGGAGRLDIEVAIKSVGNENALSLPAGKPGAYARLLIRDNGCGMDEATKERIFDPFFTTKEVGEGTGMGLSVVHGIVTDYGGMISVKSTKGQGTTFEILFPLHGAASNE